MRLTVGHRVRATSGAILIGLALALSGCSGNDGAWTYSADEVRSAFRDAGYPLIKIAPPAGIQFPSSEGTYFEPQGGGPPWVLVTSPANVEDSWAGFVKVGGDSDSLTMRRANVLFISDGGMSPSAKVRARQAMDGLPDRGFDTEVIEQP